MERSSGVCLGQAPVQSSAVECLGPFQPHCWKSFVVCLFLVLWFFFPLSHLPPFPVVSPNSSAAAYWTEWWMYPSSNYTSLSASNFEPYHVSDVAHSSCTSACADKIGGSPGPGKKNQQAGQTLLQCAKCCHSKCPCWSHDLRLLHFMQMISRTPISHVTLPGTELVAATLPAGHWLNPNPPLTMGQLTWWTACLTLYCTEHARCHHGSPPNLSKSTFLTKFHTTASLATME